MLYLSQLYGFQFARLREIKEECIFFINGI